MEALGLRLFMATQLPKIRMICFMSVQVRTVIFLSITRVLLDTHRLFLASILQNKLAQMAYFQFSTIPPIIICCSVFKAQGQAAAAIRLSSPPATSALALQVRAVN